MVEVWPFTAFGYVVAARNNVTRCGPGIEVEQTVRQIPSTTDLGIIHGGSALGTVYPKFSPDQAETGALNMIIIDKGVLPVYYAHVR